MIPPHFSLVTTILLLTLFKVCLRPYSVSATRPARHFAIHYFSESSQQPCVMNDALLFPFYRWGALTGQITCLSSHTRKWSEQFDITILWRSTLGLSYSGCFIPAVSFSPHSSIEVFCIHYAIISDATCCEVSSPVVMVPLPWISGLTWVSFFPVHLCAARV